MQEFETHRVARLADLRLEGEVVNKIRGMVIAGREAGCNPDHLSKLKKRGNDGFGFMTYDDLLGSLDLLIEKLKNI